MNNELRNWSLTFIGLCCLVIAIVVIVIGIAPTISRQPYCRDGEAVMRSDYEHKFYCVPARLAEWK